MDLLAVFREDTSYIYGIAIVVTIIALAISTRYSIRNLFNIHGSVDVSSNKSQIVTDNACPTDVAGSDGDDEADPEEEMNYVSDEQELSPESLDPLFYFEHIQGDVKRVKQSVATRIAEQSLTEQQLMEEREAQCRQLAEIFRLMQERQDQFGIGSLDDMQEQMKLYGV